MANLEDGGVAQMVERSLSMREVPGSIPGASNNFHFFKSRIIPSNQANLFRRIIIIKQDK